MKDSISKYFWPFGVTLLSGLLGMYAATLALFSVGVVITKWHGIAFLFTGGLAGLLCFPGASWDTRLKRTGKLLTTCLLVVAVLAAVSGRFDDLTWDGMNARIESVLALSAGWNPVQDPRFQAGVELVKSNPYLQGSFVVQSGYQYSFGNLTAAYLAALTGNLNCGKAITPLLGLASFGVAYGGLAALGLSFRWSLALALMAALNPVVVYQSSSFYIDGHTGSMFTAMLFSALRLLATGLKADSLICLIVSFLGLSASKTSGLFYGVIIDVVFLAFYALLHRKALRPFLIFLGVSALVTWPVGLLFRKVGGFPDLTLAYLQTATSIATENYGVGGKSGAPREFLHQGKFENFLSSHLAPTEIWTDQARHKFPFWLTRPELAVFHDLTPDPRAGGFGPLYGASLLLALASLGLLWWWKRPPVAAFFPLLPVLISLGLTQSWWARWAPQGWLLPLALLLPAACSPSRRFPGSLLPASAGLVGLANSLLILGFYSAGCLKLQGLLESQLAYLQRLSQPLTVHMPRFQSNRIWFWRNQITFQAVPAEVSRPRMLFKKSSTQVALPPDWRSHLPTESSVNTWKNEKILEE